jgi:cell division septation protein DedD
MAMAVRQARRQLQFTGFEMALIAVSFLVTVTTVFFLGLFVGKKNASYHAPTEDRVARIPVDDFTRYKRPEPIARAPKEPKPAAVEGEGVVASATAKAPAAAPTATAGDGKAVPVAPAVTGPAAPAAADPMAKAPAVPATADVATADAAAKAKEAAAKEAAAKEAAAAKAKAEKAEEPTGRGYTVQLLSTRKSAEAEALVKKLNSRGYAANIKKMADGEGAWYRVRVGSYGAFSEARAMADKCRRDLGLGQAFVSTE